MHFSGTLAVVVILFCCCVAYLFLTLGSYDTHDRLSYEKLLLVQSGSANAYISRQQRLGLQKDVLLTQGGRLRLKSASAELEFDYHDGQTDAIEHMHDLVCCMQEELFYRLPGGREATMQPDGRLLLKHADAKDPASWFPANFPEAQPLQVIRQVKAISASYHYTKDLFTARDVALFRYIAPGHTIEKALEQLQPLMSGSAALLEFSSGESVILSGNARVEHELGSFSAEKMILHMSHEKESGPYGLLQMRGDVSLAFKDGGQLACANADLDFQLLAGTFFGSTLHEEVVYTEQLRAKKSEEIVVLPLIIKSRTMSVNFSESSVKVSGQSKHDISKMSANECVTVNYNDDFIALADDAVYLRNPEALISDNALPGTIVMRADGSGSKCQVVNQNGDFITASEIHIDTTTKKFTFFQPVGALVGGGGNAPDHEGRVDFSAGTLVWDDASGMLLLNDNVDVNQKGIGRLETNSEMRLYRAGDKGRKTLKALETVADTLLTYCDKDKNLSHTLLCSGPIKADHVKLETRFYAKCDEKGIVPEGKQLFFQDAYGKFFADKALVKYVMAAQTPALRKIILAGNVRILNQQPSAESQAAEVQQYALADRVDYTPDTKEMIFKTLSPGHRVLFFDKANNLQVSAPALKVTRDKAANRDTVQGIGDVRFSFMESEFQQLRQRFSLERSEFIDGENSLK